MKKISDPILFFGNERLATGVYTSAPTLTKLIEEGYNVAAVISNYETGRSRSARELEIAAVAEKHNIPLLLPNRLGDIKDELASFGAGVAVLVAYGKIVPASIIDLFPVGIINIHPSLLPLHRGPTPIESVILDSETRTGVSLMKLALEMDAGPVYAQSDVELTGQETKQQMADLLLEIGSQMVIELLPDIIAGKVTALPQDNSRVTYDHLISKEDGLVDWDKPAERLAREVRAYAEWPKSRADLAGKEVIITQAYDTPTVADGQQPGDVALVLDAGIIMVATGEGSLCIQRLKPAGKQEMSAKEFMAGYGRQLGV